MFNLSLPELLVIGAAGLLVFGPKRLPELAKSLGKGIRDFKKAMEGEEDEKSPTEALPPVPHSPATPTEPRAAEPVASETGSDPASRKTS